MAVRPRPGERLGGWLLERLLGQGGMGAVFVGLHEPTGARRAIKVPFFDDDALGEARARFELEAQLLARIAPHRHVVRVHGTGHERGVTFCVLELVDGEGLDSIVARQGALPVPRALELAEQIARGLAQLHASEVLHRDMKPANVLIRHEDGSAVITDFGLARDASSERERLTKTGAMLGTPAYMPPEQIEGSNDLDARADVYSLGATLYELVTGQPPFQGDSLVGIVKKVLSDPVAPPSSVRPGVPPEVDAVVLRALSKDREVRFRSASELADELARARKGEKIRTELAVQRRRTLPLAAVGLVAVVVAGGVAIGTRRVIGTSGGPSPVAVDPAAATKEWNDLAAPLVRTLEEARRAATALDVSLARDRPDEVVALDKATAAVEAHLKDASNGVDPRVLEAPRSKVAPARTFLRAQRALVELREQHLDAALRDLDATRRPGEQRGKTVEGWLLLLDTPRPFDLDRTHELPVRIQMHLLGHLPDADFLAAREKIAALLKERIGHDARRAGSEVAELLLACDARHLALLAEVLASIDAPSEKATAAFFAELDRRAGARLFQVELSRVNKFYPVVMRLGSSHDRTEISDAIDLRMQIEAHAPDDTVEGSSENVGPGGVADSLAVLTDKAELLRAYVDLHRLGHDLAFDDSRLVNRNLPHVAERRAFVEKLLDEYPDDFAAKLTMVSVLRDHVNARSAPHTDAVRRQCLDDCKRALELARNVADAPWVNVRARCTAVSVFAALSLSKLSLADEARIAGVALDDDGTQTLREALERIEWSEGEVAQPDEEASRACALALTLAAHETGEARARELELGARWARRAVAEADKRFAAGTTGFDRLRVRPGHLELSPSPPWNLLDAREYLVWALLAKRDLDAADAIAASCDEIARGTGARFGSDMVTLLRARAGLLEAQVRLARGRGEAARDLAKAAASSFAGTSFKEFDRDWPADQFVSLAGRLGVAGFDEASRAGFAIAQTLHR